MIDYFGCWNYLVFNLLFGYWLLFVVWDLVFGYSFIDGNLDNMIKYDDS